MIVVVGTGGANLASVFFALKRLGKEAVYSENASEIARASHVILPGVATANAAMERLNQAKLIETLRSLKQPVLGICLGMQLLFESSEEGGVDCLGVLPGEVKRMLPKPAYPIPHMGWNELEIKNGGSPILPEGSSLEEAYFVHSFVAPTGPWVKASSWHGSEVPAIVQKDNFHGAQFHPEKSSKFGSMILERFLSL